MCLLLSKVGVIVNVIVTYDDCKGTHIFVCFQKKLVTLRRETGKN